MKMASNHGKEHHGLNFYMNVDDQALNTFSHNIECNFRGGQTDVNKLLLVTYWVKQSVEGLLQQLPVRGTWRDQRRHQILLSYLHSDNQPAVVSECLSFHWQDPQARPVKVYNQKFCEELNYTQKRFTFQI